MVSMIGGEEEEEEREGGHKVITTIQRESKRANIAVCTEGIKQER
jgi:hypothetical protein